MHTNKHVCAFLSVSVLNAYAWEHSKDEDRKRDGVEGGVAGYVGPPPS